MQGLEKEKRERLILTSLLERRVAAEEEGRSLRSDLTDLSRREIELREEIVALDAILGALPEPAKENEAPSLFVKTPAPEPAPPAREAPKPRRRRKGGRRAQMLPLLRERFGEKVFGTEDVTDVVQKLEGGDRRKAYFAAWSLTRDLEEDGVIAVVSEEGSGKRKKKTYRFAPA